MKREPIDNHAAWEYIVGILEDVQARLRAGARGSGVTLTAGECKKLLATGIKPLPRPKGHHLPLKIGGASLPLQRHIARARTAASR